MSTFIWPEKTQEYVDFHRNIFTIYGIPKIGKSTLASQFSDALLIDTEDASGTKHLDAAVQRIQSWLELRDYVKWMAGNIGKCPFKTIFMDTADNLTVMCDDYVCARKGVEVLGDVEYGKGFASYTREFKRVVGQILRLGLGVGFISHATKKDVDVNILANAEAATRANMNTGMVEITVPSLEKRALKYVLDMSDIILYLEIDGNMKRVIRTQPTLAYQAGDRSGRLPSTIPLDYNALLDAYYSGGGSNDGLTEIRERVTKGQVALAQGEIDGFNVTTRAVNWNKKHLGVTKVKDCDDLAKLQAGLHDLTMKWSNNNNTKQEKENA